MIGLLTVRRSAYVRRVDALGPGSRWSARDGVQLFRRRAQDPQVTARRLRQQRDRPPRPYITGVGGRVDDGPPHPIAGTGGARRERSVALRREVTGSHDLYLVAKGGTRVAALDRLTIRP